MLTIIAQRATRPAYLGLYLGDTLFREFNFEYGLVIRIYPHEMVGK